MAISDRIEAIEQHLQDDYSVLTLGGADLTNVDKNIVNLKSQWMDRLKYYLNNGIDVVYNNWNKVIGEGTSLTLNNTMEGKMKLNLKGNTSQYSTTGKNKVNFKKANTLDIINGYVDLTQTYSSGTNITFTIDEITLEAGNYTLCFEDSASGTNSDQTLYINESTSIGTLHYKNDKFNYANFTLNNSTTISSFKVWLPAAYIGKLSKIMLLSGTYSTTQDYEPYTNGASPNPDYPQDIHVVSGDNTIKVEGKNLFDVASANLVQKGVNSSAGIISGTNLTRLETDNLILLKSGTYTISNAICNNVWVWAYDLNQNYLYQKIMAYWYTGNSYTFTINEDLYVRFLWSKSDSSEIDITSNFQIQLEKNNQATTYEAYTNQTQLISLGVENLCSSVTKASNTTIDFYFNKPRSKTLTIQFIINDDLSNTSLYFIGTGVADRRVAQLTGTAGTIIADTFTLTDEEYNSLSATNNHLQLYKSGANFNVPTNVQLEIGSKANSYTPYGTTPIELCKISTYQDYIYKEDDKWYLHKEIGKVVLDGSEDGWANDSTGYLCGIINNDVKRNTSATTIAEGYCNYYVPSTLNNSRSNTNQYSIYSGSTNTSLYFNNNSMSLNDFKTWLSTHNTIVYYVLATPTNTEITDTTLISQLNNLANVNSYNGQTNVSQSNNDLASVLNVTALENM